MKAGFEAGLNIANTPFIVCQLKNTPFIVCPLKNTPFIVYQVNLIEWSLNFAFHHSG